MDLTIALKLHTVLQFVHLINARFAVHVALGFGVEFEQVMLALVKSSVEQVDACSNEKQRSPCGVLGWVCSVDVELPKHVAAQQQAR